MVKILAAGDFHGDISRADFLAKKAIDENVDLIILNGDIVEEDKIEGIIGKFKATGKKILLVPGNHDFIATEVLAQKYDVTNLHGKALKVGDVGFIGCGGANIGLNMLHEDEIYDLIKQASKYNKDVKRTVFITHVHPADTKMASFSDFVPGSTGLKNAISAFKPDLVLCGHVHEAEGIEEKVDNTLVVNVGKSGKIIDL
ncbi:hypothetical protein DRJ22_01405 [Candidatus Woesearchaeota archaeon]|nr:MAG: hypothetical protein B6U93_00755 [Candidatus Woesearchaeota archaeon ex4484_78]RLE46658.1 MAG: hypothetical protein DRJ22_01405 [Candidatus Woesearchaeota archaeon]